MTTGLNWRELREHHLPAAAADLMPPRIKLPMLPQALLEFSRKADDPRAGARELGLIIQGDAGLTAELLRLVNSSLFGLRVKAGTAAQAISLLGARQTKLLLLTTGLQSALSARESTYINLKSFWNTNLERALFAREVAKLLHADGDLAFATALIQDALLPLLTMESTAVYQEFLALPDGDAPCLAEFEQKKWGWNHASSAALIMTKWGLPDDLVLSIALHHRGLALLDDPVLGRTGCAAAAVASLLPDRMQQVRDGFVQLVELQARWPEFDLLRIAAKVEADFESYAPGSSKALGLTHRCDVAIQGCAPPAPAASRTPIRL